VTSSKDRRCLVWSVRERTCVAVGEGHTDAIGAVCVSQNKATYASRAAFVASGAADKILKRWALPTHSFATATAPAKLVATHSVRAHDKDINAVAVSPNDSLIASASQDKSVRLWRSSDLTPVATLNGHKRGVWKVCFSPIDKVLVSCSGDRTVKMWSVVDHCLLRTFEGHTASVLAVKFVNRGSQLVSASADGLIRVWTIRSGECEATLDTHTDRVWALECLDSALTESVEAAEGEASEEAASLSAPNMFFFSGGSDSRLIQWKDATAEEERTRMHEAERNLVLEQQMQNDLRNKRYDRALATALDLGHSLKVLNILTAILEVEGKRQSAVSTTAGKKGDAFTSDWSRRLDPYVKAFTPEQLDKVVTYLKEWNTNARHCYTSQVLLHALLRLVRAEELMKHRVVLEALPALLSYSERHYQRLDRLNQASYMLDYFASMIALLPVEEAEKSRVPRNSTKPATTEVTHSGDADEPLVLFKAAAGTDSEATDDDDDESSVEETVVKTAKVAAPSAISGSASGEKGTKRKAAVDAKPSKGVKKTKGKV
jgi:U3 small nucleolar RNA-associated protein 13